MKREILFRGKRVDNGEWVEGFYYYSARYGMHVIKVSKDLDDGNFIEYDIEVIPETVGQFTGLTDKNGVKIFEGDKLSLTDPYNGLTALGFGEVIFSYEYVGGWVLTSDKLNRLNIGTRMKYVEVIGNIHDNPELI